ncbi:hypothetical protein HDU76_003761 [Blyttiomyces sp. JEL0837]|nr:hypothetical protein HDU76_003761 [Blyttiomyces sp. JEL0837]
MTKGFGFGLFKTGARKDGSGGEGDRSADMSRQSIDPSGNSGRLKYSVRVNHAASQQSIKIDVMASLTLQEFLAEIAKEMNMDSSSINLFYMDSEYRVKVKGDQSFQEALTETNMFAVEGSISQDFSVTTKSDYILTKVTYDIVYARVCSWD